MRRIAARLLTLGCLVGGAAVVVAEGTIESGSGTLVTRQLDLSGFTEIEVPGTWQVEVTPGPYAVAVTVDDNLLDDLQVERHGSALRFGLRPGRFRRVTLRAEVTMPQLAAVRVSGSGEVVFSAFASPQVQVAVSGSGAVRGNRCRIGSAEIDLSGSGDVGLHDGTVEEAAVSISGSGSVTLRAAAGHCVARTLSLSIGGSGSADLGGCRFDTAQVRISGSGDASLTLGSGDLTGRISGSGSIRYRGTPTRVDVRSSGSGRVIKEG